MPDDFDVRLATAVDLPALVALGHRVVPDTYDSLVGVTYSAALLAAWWGPTLAEAVGSGLVHVATAADAVVGMVELGTYEGEPVVWKLYVDRDRRHGLGPALLAAVAATLDPATDRLLIEHIAANIDAARFYEGEGFTEIGRDPAEDDRTSTVWRARPVRDHDEYTAMAEYHEVLMDPAWCKLQPHLAAAFGHLGRGQVVADLGAGSGVGTLALARATAAEIVAIEPDRTMRSMLLARLSGAGEVDRVTVHAAALPAGLALLPGRLDGAVAAHMLGHLPAAAWRHVLAWLGDHLAPGAPVVLTTSFERSRDDDHLVEEARFGRHRYRATHRPAGEDTYETRFEILAGDSVVLAHVATGQWRRVTADDVVAALPPGMVADLPEPGVLIVRTPV
ncbi:MAG: GNAT family N-acetyltransferase [Ilumatobacteraceae bacterium]